MTRKSQIPGSYFIHQNSRERMINFAVTHARDQTNARPDADAFVCIRNKEATSELSQVMTNCESYLKNTGASTQNKTYSQKKISKNSKIRPSLLMPTMIPSVLSVESRVRASRSRGWPAGSSHALFVYKMKIVTLAFCACGRPMQIHGLLFKTRFFC